MEDEKWKLAVEKITVRGSRVSSGVICISPTLEDTRAMLFGETEIDRPWVSRIDDF